MLHAEAPTTPVPGLRWSGGRGAERYVLKLAAGQAPASDGTAAIRIDLPGSRSAYRIGDWVAGWPGGSSGEIPAGLLDASRTGLRAGQTFAATVEAIALHLPSPAPVTYEWRLVSNPVILTPAAPPAED